MLCFGNVQEADRNHAHGQVYDIHYDADESRKTVTGNNELRKVEKYIFSFSKS
jgi:hypothetical protein